MSEFKAGDFCIFKKVQPNEYGVYGSLYDNKGLPHLVTSVSPTTGRVCVTTKGLHKYSFCPSILKKVIKPLEEDTDLLVKALRMFKVALPLCDNKALLEIAETVEDIRRDVMVEVSKRVA